MQIHVFIFLLLIQFTFTGNVGSRSNRPAASQNPTETEDEAAANFLLQGLDPHDLPVPLETSHQVTDFD